MATEASGLDSMIAEAREMQESGQYINGRVFHALVAEIERLRALVEAAKRWRYSHHHGTREEIDIAEECLLDALDGDDEQSMDVK